LPFRFNPPEVVGRLVKPGARRQQQRELNQQMLMKGKLKAVGLNETLEFPRVERRHSTREEWINDEKIAIEASGSISCQVAWIAAIAAW
jgi:hypothetical protein